MDFFSLILWPLKWAVELILVAWHGFFSWLGLDPAAGSTWVFSIVGLVLVVRAAVIPLFVRQIKSSRRMMEVAPQLKKIKDKYKGKSDQFSREAMTRETMEVYKKNGTSPFSSCLPMLVQAPIFFALYSVLNDAHLAKVGVGAMTTNLASQFSQANLFGIAPLSDSFAKHWQLMTMGKDFSLSVLIIAMLLVVFMTASQFFTQLQLTSKNMSAEVKESPMYKQQRVMLYIFPLIFAISGIFFPLAVMFYWLTSNVWMIGQQFFVIRKMPTPGSEAAAAREKRLAKKITQASPLDIAHKQQAQNNNRAVAPSTVTSVTPDSSSRDKNPRESAHTEDNADLSGGQGSATHTPVSRKSSQKKKSKDHGSASNPGHGAAHNGGQNSETDHVNSTGQRIQPLSKQRSKRQSKPQ